MVTRISKRFLPVAVVVRVLARSAADAFYVGDGGGKRISTTPSSSSSSSSSPMATYPEQPKASSLFHPKGGGLVGTVSGRTRLDDLFSSPSSAAAASSSLQQQQQPRILPAANNILPVPTIIGPDDWSPVLAAGFLITSNTVGAGCLVMPALAAGPGMATTTAIFGAAYLVNLVSGLLLAHVAIVQREQQIKAEVINNNNNNNSSVVVRPCSSFKELAETTLDNPTAATMISTISIATNACVHAFTVSRVGMVGSALVGGLVAPHAVSIVWATALLGLLATQSSRTLSQTATVAVTALLVSFGGLLVPGLWSVADPVGTFLAAGTASDWTQSVATAAPVMCMSMIYQNIVPTVAKLLDYHRTKVTTALVVGSLVPLCMYTAWCFCCLGGGMDDSGSMIGSGGSGMVGLQAALYTVFSVSTLAGSSLGTGLAMASELESFLGGTKKQVDAPLEKGDATRFGLPAAAVAVGLPLAAALTWGGGGDGFTEALSIAGSFGSPLLYGVIPVAMAWQQQQNKQQQQQQQPAKRNLSGPPPFQKMMVPAFSLPILGACSMGFIGPEVVQRVTEAFAF